MRNVVAILALSGFCAQAQTITETFGSGANQFSIEFVAITRPGNTPDTAGSPNPVGRVDYKYNIGKYEISRDMIDKANAGTSLGITMWDMTDYGGNGPNRPATGISWNEAARFVNYLNASKGYQAAYNFTTTENNANITLWGAGQYSGSNQFRHKDAYYFLPSLDEWYKAAYGRESGDWYIYPTLQNPLLVSGVSGGTSFGTAVYGQSVYSGPADVSNSGGLSPFGTMGQGGNVEEWMESSFDGINDSETDVREIRGGSWGAGNNALKSSNRGGPPQQPDLEGSSIGFRIAMVPEPSSLSLLLAGGAVLMAGRRRR